MFIYHARLRDDYDTFLPPTHSSHTPSSPDKSRIHIKAREVHARDNRTLSAYCSMRVLLNKLGASTSVTERDRTASQSTNTLPGRHYSTAHTHGYPTLPSVSHSQSRLSFVSSAATIRIGLFTSPADSTPAFAGQNLR